MTATKVNPQEQLNQFLAQSKADSFLDPSFAAFMDDRDPLKDLRTEFIIPTRGEIAPGASNPEESCIYFCGNSLGLLPKAVKRYVSEELEVWGEGAVNSHFKHRFGRPWVRIEETVQEQSARVVGAKKDEVAIMNTLTSNLHALFAAFYTPTKDRHKVLIESKAFPSDHYAIESQIRWHGLEPKDSLICQEPREGETLLRTEDILETIEKHGEEIAVVCFSGIQFYTGQYFEIEKITKAAQAKGCIVGWDLAHAAGNVPVQLHDWNVDFACWCSYKYLNSGPGGIAGIFVHERHANDFGRNRLAGWWGHDKGTRFDMVNEFKPIPGAAGFQHSNPSVLTTSALLGSLSVFEKTTMQDMRAKSYLLTGYLYHLLITEFSTDVLDIITPSDPEQRGCQLSLVFKRGKMMEIFEELAKKAIIGDERKPDVIRVAPTPLYSRFEDVRRFVVELKELVKEIYH
ncbi:kynureninase [Gamsiella multidivaricata]|uniref:kynureninase n=1 Tax=Gamsiella multidivaricata TaxID=101098 RepID=UPI0022203FA9|nr:kynureninase [Gamsiella multidivaricata]KAG0365085.1 Kynureninase (L-kynurenine hydrolase) [Gamsiella multidivaricata]KAI7822032.1 kynureninase [Gamsiella multidivaricata]